MGDAPERARLAHVSVHRSRKRKLPLKLRGGLPIDLVRQPLCCAFYGNQLNLGRVRRFEPHGSICRRDVSIGHQRANARVGQGADQRSDSGVGQHHDERTDADHVQFGGVSRLDVDDVGGAVDQ